MGGGQSTYTGPSGLDVPDREGGDGSPDVFMIEPVPEGLEHVVYPKYEEAFRLGLEALTNPMRVNKFYRPLPHILGSIEFQKHSHAGIIPVAKPAGSSGMPTPRQTPFGRRPQVSGTYDAERRAPSASEEEAYEKCEKEIKEEEAIGNDWNTVKQAVTLEFSSAHHSYADFEAIQDTEPKTPSKTSAASEADVEGYGQSAKIDSVSSVQALDGGLFDADEAMMNALESYRQMHGGSRNERLAGRTSSRRSQLTRISTGRSQMSRDLEQLGKRISDLQQGLTSSGRSQLTNVAEDSQVTRGAEQPSESVNQPRQGQTSSSPPQSSSTNQSRSSEDQLDDSDEEIQQDQTPSSPPAPMHSQENLTRDLEQLGKSIEEVLLQAQGGGSQQPRSPFDSPQDSEKEVPVDDQNTQ